MKSGAGKRTWQRLFLSLIGIAIVAGMWRWATFHLYALPPHAIASFTSITNNAAYVIGAIVIFMVTGRLIYEWKNQTASQVIEQAQTLVAREEHTERVIAPKNFDDESIS